MSRKTRKPRPSPPKWYWTDSDYCYSCKNRNGCSHCKVLLHIQHTEFKKRKRNISTKLQRGDY